MESGSTPQIYKMLTYQNLIYQGPFFIVLDCAALSFKALIFATHTLAQKSPLRLNFDTVSLNRAEFHNESTEA